MIKPIKQQYLITIYSKHNGFKQLKQMLQDEIKAETIEAFEINK